MIIHVLIEEIESEPKWDHLLRSWRLCNRAACRPGQSGLARESRRCRRPRIPGGRHWRRLLRKMRMGS